MKPLHLAVGAGILLLILGVLFLIPDDAPQDPAQQQSAQATTSTSARASTKKRAATAVRASTVAISAGKTLQGDVVAAGPWGSRLGEFGRRADPEAASEGPMSLATDGEDVLVVDQVNARVQRFRRGVAVSSFQIGDTVHDLALTKDGRTITLDRLVDQEIQIYDARGQPKNSAPIVGPGLDEGGKSTGVFAENDGIYVEREHGTLVRVSDSEGNADGDRKELPGRPTRDGRLVVTAALVDAASGSLIVTAFDRTTFEPRWSRALSMEALILQVLMLDSDPSGKVYVAAATAMEGPEPNFELFDAKIRVVRLSAEGAIEGVIDLPPLSNGEDIFRPLTVGEDGAIYLMISSEKGVEIRRFTF